MKNKTKENKVELKKGIRIYYNGDMANHEGTGAVIEIKETKWGTDIIIKMDDGRDITVSPCNFSDEYLGHGGTRFVTLDAYNEWRKKRYAAIGIEIEPATRIA